MGEMEQTAMAAVNLEKGKKAKQKRTKKKTQDGDTLLCLLSSVFFSVCRSVEKLPRGKSAFQLLPQQLPLLLGALHDASVLLGSPRQVGNHLIHWSIGDILIDGEACLACRCVGTNQKEKEHF